METNRSRDLWEKQESAAYELRKREHARARGVSQADLEERGQTAGGPGSGPVRTSGGGQEKPAIAIHPGQGTAEPMREPQSLIIATDLAVIKGFQQRVMS